MAEEKVNSGPEEINAAEPEVTEQTAVDTPPEAAAPEPEVTEPAEPAAGEPAVAEPEQEPPGEAPPPQAENPEPPTLGEDGEVVVDFEKISELIAKRNQAAREAVEQEAAAAAEPDTQDKGAEEPAPEEAPPKRRGRKPKEDRAEQAGPDAKPRRGRKPKEAAPDKDAPEGKPRDKVSRGRRGKAEIVRAAPVPHLPPPPIPGAGRCEDAGNGSVHQAKRRHGARPGPPGEGRKRL